MLRRLHLIASTLALVCIATFFLSTIFVELIGSRHSIASLKHLIVSPGLWILVPAIIATGASGVLMSRKRQGRLVALKKKRMPFIAANGLLVLLPCAILLNQWASAGNLDTRFYFVQVIELIAGATNLALMGMNMRDGLRLSGRLLRVAPHRQ
jgi:hypothetical protein